MPEQAADLGRNGAPAPAAGVLCTWSPDPSNPYAHACTQRAAWHVRPLDGQQPARWTVKACQAHMALVAPQADDWHPVSPACAHPARLWVESTPTRRSGCAMPRESAGAVAA